MPVSYVFPRGSGGGAPALPPLTLTSPPTLSRPFGSTSGTLVSNDATGGTAPYTYEAAITYDSTGSGTAYISSINGKNINFALLTNGIFLQVLITVTDSLGATAYANAVVTVESVAAGPMTPGAFPASQNLDTGTTAASIAFNPVGGSFTAPVTYVASLISGEANISNVGTAVSLTGMVDDTVQFVRLRATDSTTPTPLEADAYAVVSVSANSDNPLTWKRLVDIDLEDAANAQGPFVSGSQSVPLLNAATGNTITATLVNSMNSGSFANITSEITAGDGWRMTWAAIATSTNVKAPLKIPLPIIFGNDDDIRVTIVGTTSQPVSPNSSYWQVNKDTGVPPNDDDADCWGGNRILKNGANTALYLKYQAGGSPAIITNSSTPPCPLNWLDGSTEITMTCYLPRYTYRARISHIGTGSSLASDLGAPSTAASNNALRGGWCAGNNAVWIFHGGSNGGANGGGNQWTKISRIIIERRTLP